MKLQIAAISLFCAIGVSACFAQQKISLQTNQKLTRADIYIQPFQGTAKATLILCPGQNGNGEDMMAKKEWKDFALKENLNLVGISFASPNSYLEPNSFSGGYYVAPDGSGQALVDGLNLAFGSDQPPLLIYGFSGGAHFTYSFVKSQPSLVKAWCSYSAGWWEEPDQNQKGPPGIIACGEYDSYNYGPSLMQFTKGRKLGNPWTWLSLPNTGHSWSVPLENFVRLYFAAIIDHPQDPPVWLDVDAKTPLTPEQLKQFPTMGVWLPNLEVANEWKLIHNP